jgi:dehydrogenase/reductase SDR family protein 7B
MAAYFKGKVCWITGASSGIGEALAIALAEQGACLVLSARRESLLLELSLKCPGAEKIKILPFDLIDIHLFDNMTQEVINSFGKVDFLFNNGGIGQRSLVSETPLEIDRRMMEINYFSNIALAKAVLPYMLKNNNGHIIAMSSLAGKLGFFYRSAYSASKHALHGFYEALRLENMEHGIRVTLVCPGYIKTNISLNALNASGEKHGIMDQNQASGMSANKCAALILKGVQHKKMELLIGGKERIPVFLKRFLPVIFYWLMPRLKPAK